MPAPRLLALVGPTASGKTAAAVQIALRLGAEILSVDSTLVYRAMDVGTAKPSVEERALVPHHLLDLLEPGATFSVAVFQRLAAEVADDVSARGRQPLVVSAGGLYYRAVVDDLEFPPTVPAVRRLLETEALVLEPAALYERLEAFDPEAARRIERGNLRRTVRALEVAGVTGRRFSSYLHRWDRYPASHLRVAGVDIPRDALHGRIDRRVAEMVPGLLAETARLLDSGFESFLTTSRPIGYAEAVARLRGEIDQREMVALMARRTKGLARRQLAWLRRDPRIHWIRAGADGAPGIVDALTDCLRGGAHGRARRPAAVGAEG